MNEIITMLTEILITDSSYQPTLQIKFQSTITKQTMKNNCKVSMMKFLSTSNKKILEILFELTYTIS